MQRKRASGVGGVTGRSSTTKSSARRAHMASSAGSRAGVQGAVATFAAPESCPGLREVFGRWNCRAKMRPGQQSALRAFASARQRCVHGVSRILVMTSTSEIRLAGRQRVLAQSICSKSAFTECACAVFWMETLLPLLYGARGGAEPRQQSAFGLPNWVPMIGGSLRSTNHLWTRTQRVDGATVVPHTLLTSKHAPPTALARCHSSPHSPPG